MLMVVMKGSNGADFINKQVSCFHVCLGQTSYHYLFFLFLTSSLLFFLLVKMSNMGASRLSTSPL